MGIEGQFLAVAVQTRGQLNFVGRGIGYPSLPDARERSRVQARQTLA